MRGLGAEIAQFFRQGLLDPQAIYYHLRYAFRFQHLGMGRRLIP